MLSEGVTTYLTARVIEEVYGAVEAQAVWDDYALSVELGKLRSMATGDV